ncbi:MAG: ATP-binding protein [Euryarchaeota archaeon]|nr:ATP-binding protein [Euryarchaeota archaeon]
MKRIAFHDRERETDEIMKILDAEPSLITFIYGPINSGKTTLISHLIKELPEDYAPFYVNLRGRFITDYEDFLNVLFEIDEEGGVDNVAEYAKSILKDLGAISGIPIPINLFERIFEKKDKSKDVFKYIEQFFVEISKTRTPILIVDELQVIGDLKIDGLLIYKLFNFFIRLTKELHLAHIFVITSDSLFIERVYSEAMLEGRCRYLLVDDFDNSTTINFLDKYKFSDTEKEVAWNYCGGKPACLVELINARENRKRKAEEMLKIRKGQIEEIVYSLEVKDKKMFAAVVGVFSEFRVKEKTGYKYLSDEIKFLVGKNIIFADSANKELRPQSRLNLLAIREAMENM